MQFKDIRIGDDFIADDQPGISRKWRKINSRIAVRLTPSGEEMLDLVAFQADEEVKPEIVGDLK